MKVERTSAGSVIVDTGSTVITLREDPFGNVSAEYRYRRPSSNSLSPGVIVDFCEGHIATRNVELHEADESGPAFVCRVTKEFVAFGPEEAKGLGLKIGTPVGFDVEMKEGEAATIRLRPNEAGPQVFTQRARRCIRLPESARQAIPDEWLPSGLVWARLDEGEGWVITISPPVSSAP